MVGGGGAGGPSKWEGKNTGKERENCPRMANDPRRCFPSGSMAMVTLPPSGAKGLRGR